MKTRTIVVIGVVLVTLALPAALYAQASDPRSVAEAFYAAAAARDTDALVALFAADAVGDGGVFGVYTGHEEIHAWFEPQLTEQNARVDHEFVEVDGDIAVFRDIYTSDAFDFALEWTVEFTVDDGKITHLLYTLTDETMEKVGAWMAAQQVLPATGEGQIPVFIAVSGAVGALALVGGIGLLVLRRRSDRQGV